MLGAWFCPTCNQGGCWPAGKSCFRCGEPRPAQDAVPITPARPARRKKGFFREEQFLGRQPQTGSGGCPTTRVPPNVAPAGSAPPNGPLPPGEVPLPPLNADMMLAWLRQLGLDTEVIAQVTSKLPPPQSPLLGSLSALCLTWPTKKSSCKVLSRSWKSGFNDQLRVMQEITDLQTAKSQEFAKVSAEYDEALKSFGSGHSDSPSSPSARGGNWTGFGGISAAGGA